MMNNVNCFPDEKNLLSFLFMGLQSVTNIMGKTSIWSTSFFYPLPPLSNVEKQRAKLASSYGMGSQHCIGEEREKHHF